MTETSPPPGPKSRFIQRWRHRLSFDLGVTQSRKIAIYEDLLNSVSLLDVSYWLQVLLSAGIASLGLVQNSPAVIIGAMLISPLMGPILANGMAFAVGDLILAARAILSLLVSCSVAVGFAMVLTTVLPFYELESEITARIAPNLLDLVIALFSGALGAVATAKEPKGVVTSIPGVSIAVALMPPLCVVGLGIGRSLSGQPIEQGLTGWRIAWGGGLLFLTNLTAITLMAMLIFSLLRVGVPSIKRRAEEWHEKDQESRWMRQFFDDLPGISRLEVVGSPRNRLIVILIPIVALMIPLGQAIGRLQNEYYSKQRQTEIRKKIQNIWRDDFSKNSDKNASSYIDTLDLEETNNVLTIQMRIFTSDPFSGEEQEDLAQRYADQLKDGDRNLVDLKLVQIETSQRNVADSLGQAQPKREIQSVAELQSELWQQLDASLSSIALSKKHQLLNYGFVLNDPRSLSVDVAYLGDRPLTQDAQEILQSDVARRLAPSEAQVELTFVDQNVGKLTFEEQAIQLSPQSTQTLDQVAELLRQYPSLTLNLQSQVNEGERQRGLDIDSAEFPLVELRVRAIRNYLKSFEEIVPSRISAQLEPTVVEQEPSTVTLVLNQRKATANIGGANLDTIPNLPNSPFIPEKEDTNFNLSPNWLPNSDRE